MIIGFFTDYQQNQWLDQFFAQTHYVGLLTSRPSRLPQTEVKTTGTGYARVAIPSGTFNAAALGATQNNSGVTFPQPVGSWGTIYGMGIYDSLTAGNLQAVISATSPITIASGDAAPVISAGALNINRS
jgi:hypothetical protein